VPDINSHEISRELVSPGPVEAVSVISLCPRRTESFGFAMSKDRCIAQASSSVTPRLPLQSTTSTSNRKLQGGRNEEETTPGTADYPVGRCWCGAPQEPPGLGHGFVNPKCIFRGKVREGRVQFKAFPRSRDPPFVPRPENTYSTPPKTSRTPGREIRSSFRTENQPSVRRKDAPSLTTAGLRMKRASP